jgi:6-pyruvoyltetrahydropterin/6-carboxytetrahydropterin synthase
MGEVYVYKIAKKFKFDAGHRLEDLPEGHQCGRSHGHTYSVEVALQSRDLLDEGWVVDFGELKWFKKLIDDTYDHRFLNDVVSFQTTSENLAKHFYEIVEEWLEDADASIENVDIEVAYVRVSETESTYAEYRK